MMSSAQGRADARQVVPAMPECVVFNDELRCNRRAVAHREGRRSVQLLIRERANRGGRLAAVPAQEVERCLLCYLCLLLGMLGIQAGDNLPGDVSNSLTAGDCTRQLNLNGVDACNVVHYDADSTAVTTRHRRTPLLVRKSFGKGGKARRA